MRACYTVIWIGLFVPCCFGKPLALWPPAQHREEFTVLCIFTSFCYILFRWNIILRFNIDWKISGCLQCLRRYIDGYIVIVYPIEYAHIVLCFVFLQLHYRFVVYSHNLLTYIHQGYFPGSGAIVWLAQCQWSNPEEYGWSQLLPNHTIDHEPYSAYFLGYTVYIPHISPWQIGLYSLEVFCHISVTCHIPYCANRCPVKISSGRLGWQQARVDNKRWSYMMYWISQYEIWLLFVVLYDAMKCCSPIMCQLFRPEYSRKTRSISWLLMSWLLKS